jgi:cytochrome P450
MVQANEDGSALSDHELMAQCALLLIAGHETTTNLIGNATLALLRNPGELARLRAQPDLAGSVVMAVLPAANRDPAAFDEPDQLDVGRGDTRHLGFSGGLHACIGAALARMETRIAMTALLARYPWMELAVTEPSQIVSWAIRGVTSLPVNVG